MEGKQELSEKGTDNGGFGLGSAGGCGALLFGRNGAMVAVTDGAARA
jgi:hypothetical protein